MPQASLPLRDTLASLPVITEEERLVCLKLLEVLEDRMRRPQRGVWTYKTLANWSGFNETDPVFQDCVQLMVVHPRLRALDMHLLYYAQHGSDDGIPLTEDAERIALRENGFLVDPHSGERVADYRSHLVPYFVPTENLGADERG